MKKEAYIIKGLPGSGKSTLAEALKGENGVICEADKYYYDEEGNYNFDPAKMGENHEKCFNAFKDACESGIQRVIQSNTNTAIWQYDKYMDVAKEHGYIVSVVLVENHHGNKSIHDVPDETLVKMEANLKKDIHISYRGSM